jgi:hypothetical protein
MFRYGAGAEMTPRAPIAQLLDAEDISDYRAFTGARSAVCAVLILPGGERLLFPFWGESLSDDSDWLPLEKLRYCSAILTDIRWPGGSARALKAARELGIAAVVDLDKNTPEGWTVAAYGT